MESKYTHRGASYLALIKRFHDLLSPETYFEIGTLNGETLKLSSCQTICVDPFFQIKSDVAGSRPATMLFQMTSDRFFGKYNPKTLFGAPVDLVFLDGLHEAETLLRDLYNIEKSCKRNSIVCMHDCVPMNEEMTGRENTGGLWTGDVWKVIPILKKYRPDIQIHTFDAGPTGLVCCTNLDPANTVLDQRYSEIWTEWRDVELQDFGFENLIQCASLVWTEKVRTAESLRRYFWL